MPAALTTASRVMCPHGGTALLLTDNGVLFAGGSAVLLETDVHEVIGCPFTVGTDYTPCVTITWEAGADSLTVDEAGVLTESSLGTCLNAEDAEQGVAIIASAYAGLDAS